MVCGFAARWRQSEVRVKALAGHAATVLARCGILSALEALDQDVHRVRVIAYHRIDDLDAEPDLDPGLISATPADFRGQMEAIASRYQAVSLEQLIAAHGGDGELPPRSVLLTFDDGYRDFEAQAWPILKELGLPAVLFVPTGFPNQPGPGFWWDRLYAALVRTSRSHVEGLNGGRLELGDAPAIRLAHRVLRTHAKTLPHDQAMQWLDTLIEELAELPSLHRVLGWDALRKMAGEGLSVCSHGNLHALCTRLLPEALAKDLMVSKQRIEDELGALAPPAVIAYPASATNGDVRKAAREAGYEMAFGGRRGIDRLPLADPHEIMRVPVHRYGTALFRAQMRPSISRLGRVVLDGRDRLRA
jgi:peptidoglycan/xylan/chitin deacetylase (PgdA/CDA1 family)